MIIYASCYILIASRSGVCDQFVSEASVFDERLFADFFFVSMDFVHTGGDNDAGDTLGVDHIGIASAKGRAQEWLKSAIAACFHSVLDYGRVFFDEIAGVMTFVDNFYFCAPLSGGGFTAIAHVGDLGVQVLDRS